MTSAAIEHSTREEKIQNQEREREMESVSETAVVKKNDLDMLKSIQIDALFAFLKTTSSRNEIFDALSLYQSMIRLDSPHVRITQGQEDIALSPHVRNARQGNLHRDFHDFYTLPSYTARYTRHATGEEVIAHASDRDGAYLYLLSGLPVEEIEYVLRS